MNVFLTIYDFYLLFCHLYTNLYNIGTAAERKRKRGGAGRAGDRLKRFFHTAIVKFGGKFTPAENKKNRVRHTTKWIASCNVPLSMVER